MVHSGATDTFNIQRGGIHTPILSIATPMTEVFDVGSNRTGEHGGADNVFTRKVLPQHQWSSEVTLTASEGQTAKLSLVEGRQSYSIQNDGPTGQFQITKSGIDQPVLTIENEVFTSMDASGQEGAQARDFDWNMAHQQGSSTTMTLQASPGSDARLVLGEGSDAYMLSSVGSDGSFDISKADLDVPLLKISPHGDDTTLFFNSAGNPHASMRMTGQESSTLSLSAAGDLYSISHSSKTKTLDFTRNGERPALSLDANAGRPTSLTLRNPDPAQKSDTVLHISSSTEASPKLVLSRADSSSFTISTTANDAHSDSFVIQKSGDDQPFLQADSTADGASLVLRPSAQTSSSVRGAL
jgi:hypothetical protein